MNNFANIQATFDNFVAGAIATRKRIGLRLFRPRVELYAGNEHHSDQYGDVLDMFKHPLGAMGLRRGKQP